jgi:hypothetical protein
MVDGVMDDERWEVDGGRSSETKVVPRLSCNGIEMIEAKEGWQTAR